MSDESPYSKREQDTYFKNIEDNFTRLFKKLENQDNVLNRIDSNHNQNQIDIAVIQDTIKDYSQVKDIVSSLVNYRWWLMGTIAVFVLLGGTVVLLVKNQIDINIDQKVQSAVPSSINDYFNEHFSKINITTT